MGNILFTEDKKQIVSLWHRVFEDSEEDILFFLNHCKNYKCLGYFVDGSLVSMLFLVDCMYSSKSGKYMYAVCTDEEYRNQGLCGALIEESKKYMQSFLWLIPAEDDLFDFYGKFGFETKLFSTDEYENKICFNESDEIIDYLYDGSAYKYPEGMVYSEAEFPIGGTGLKIKES